MNKKEEKGLVPRLRFPEFSGEWEMAKLGVLGKIISGLTYSPSDVRSSGLLVLRSSNIKNSIIELKDNVYVRTDIKGVKLCCENDILICIRNGSKSLIGKNAIISEAIPISTHGAFMAIFRSEMPQFVFQLFQLRDYKKQVEADLGATINSINATQLKKYEFIIPKEKKEQQKIADCLSSLDNLITAENKKLEAIKLHKKGLMQKLFPAEGKTMPEWRFAEFRDSGDWEEKELGEICYYKSSSFTTRDIKLKGKYDLYDANKIIGKVNEFASEQVYLTIIKDGAGVARVRMLPELTNFVSTMGMIANNELSNIYYLYYLLKSINLSMYIVGGAIPHIYFKDYSKKKLFIPKLEEQQKIADCLSSVDKLITAQAEKIEGLKLHKKALMQGLFPSAQEVN